MNEVVANEVRERTYLDSVALMRLSRSIAEMSEVVEAAVRRGERLVVDDALGGGAGRVVKSLAYDESKY